MEFARPFRRRLAVFLLAAVVTLVSVAASLAVLRHHERLADERTAIHEVSFRAVAGLLRAAQIAQEGAREAGAPLEDESLERLAELLDESAEAADTLASRVARIGLIGEATELREEIDELLATSEQLSRKLVDGETHAHAERLVLLRLAARTETATDRLDELDSLAIGMLREQVRRAVFWLQVCWVGTLAGVLLALAGVLMVLVEVLNDALAPDDLAAEVEALALQDDVQARLGLLARRHGLQEAPGGWKLRLLRVVSSRRTHLVFEAEASFGGQHMLLWGRRYRWSGLLKGFQRVLVPAFGRSVWMVLCRMHNAGMDGPLPVANMQLRRSRIPVGSILLMEHLGTLVALRSYVRSDFLLLGADERRRLLEHTGAFVRGLHELAIVGLSGRGLHARDLGTPRPRLVLCDLDKVHPLGPRIDAVAGSLLRKRDRRRIRRLFRDALSPEEQRVLERSLGAVR